MSEFLLYISCVLWNSLRPVSTQALQFPDGFLIGASTSSYQIEGAWNVDGKGESIWDKFTHTVPPIIEGGQNGDDAAKSYYFYKNDSDLLKEAGFEIYRFSISWPRILPNGDISEINQPGIDHYNEVINDLLGKNIQPMITMYHWDLPQKLQDLGGWRNSSIVDHLENYADILFSNYGDRVKWWITVNEPFFIVLISRGLLFNSTINDTLSLDSGDSSDYVVTRNILLAHMRIYRLYEKKYQKQQKGKISLSLNYGSCFPKTQSPEDIDASEREFQFLLGMFAHPIYSAEGDYPQLVRETVNNNSKAEGLAQSRLPVFTQEEIDSLKGSADFFGINHYTSSVCTAVSQNSPLSTISPYYKDINVHSEQNASLPVAEAARYEVYPEGFKLMLNRISKEYNNPQIFVTENGYGDLGGLNDTTRIKYFRDYLTQLLEAYYNDKCNIIGYTAWSLMDNFEWVQGYKTKFGLVYVDFSSTNRERIRKQSFYFFQELLKTRSIPIS